MKPFPWDKLKEKIVIGVDEVGRGCLAGPVYASAVILNTENDFSEFTDSKKISASRRDKISKQIQEDHYVGIGFATVLEIEKLNILHAALLAMKRAVEKLNLKDVDPSEVHILVDGPYKIPGLEKYTQTPVIKGDLRAAPISAASIVAKVTRDQVITDLAGQYPQYGFEKHKGYSTKVHKEAIAIHGPCPEHRRLFKGVKEFLG